MKLSSNLARATLFSFATMALLPASLTASRPPYPGPSAPACFRYGNSTCDNSGTYTCQDQACVTGDYGQIKGGSQKFIADKNVNMKICKQNTGTSCTSNRRWCGDFFTYYAANCLGPYVSSQGYQYDCQ